MPPTAPYCLSTDVHDFMLFQGVVGLSDFPSTGTPPVRKDITALVAKVASRIDMAYASVGYYVPFEVYSAETWPTHQTAFLGYLNAIGVAALFAVPANSPQIAGMRTGSRRGSGFLEEWTTLIDAIKAIGRRDESGAQSLMRAKCRAGTGANWMLGSPYPPLSDFLEGYRDPTRDDMLRDFTLRYKAFFAYNQGLQQPIGSDPTTPEWMSWWHYRHGGVYDG